MTTKGCRWKTRSTFYIWQCELHHIDCKKQWKLVPTHLGTCLELRPDQISDELEEQKYLLLSTKTRVRTVQNFRPFFLIKKRAFLDG